MPIDIIASSLGHLGDFPFKNPNEFRFTKPALFVRGTQSCYIPDESIPTIGQFFPLFQLANIDAGHWLISEQPELFRQGMCGEDVVWQSFTDRCFQLLWISLARRIED